MPIDPRMVAWDEPPTIDEKMVKWDEPKKPKPAWANAIEQGFGGIVDPILRMGTGMIAKPISDIAGLGAIPLHAMGMIQTDPRQIQQNIQQGMTFEPRTEAGASPYNPLNAIPNAIGSAIDYIRPNEAQDPASWAGAGQNALREAIPQALGIAGLKYGAQVPIVVGRGLKSAGERVMQSALNPTPTAKLNGSAAIAAKEMLARDKSVTPAGIESLRTTLDDINAQIANQVQGSSARISEADTFKGIPRLVSDFENQTNNLDDLAAIEKSVNEFKGDRRWQGDAPNRYLSIQDAQAIKQGNNVMLRKKFGQQTEAATETQKAMGWGLKEAIAEAEPLVAGLNAEESRLIPTLDIAERRVLMRAGQNIQGLAALRLSNPAEWANAMADRSPLFQSLLARMMYKAGNKLSSMDGLSKALNTPLRFGVPLLQSIKPEPVAPFQVESIPFRPPTISPLDMPTRSVPGEQIPSAGTPSNLKLLDDSYKSADPIAELEQAYQLRQLIQEAMRTAEKDADLNGFNSAENFKRLKLEQLQQKYPRQKRQP